MFFPNLRNYPPPKREDLPPRPPFFCPWLKIVNYFSTFFLIWSYVDELFVNIFWQGVLDGKYDDLSEQSFYMVGGIDEVIAKAEKIAKESAA